MHRSQSNRWVNWVIQHPALIVLGWTVLTLAIRFGSPGWDKVALDGDFDYLPAEMSSVAGGRLLDEAFPGDRSRSEIVLVLARTDNTQLLATDSTVGFDLLRRLYHRLGEACWKRAIDLGYPSGQVKFSDSAQPWLNLALEAFDAAIAADDLFYESIADQVPTDQQTLTTPRIAIAYWDRANLRKSLGGDQTTAAKDFDAALTLKPDLPNVVLPIQDRAIGPWEAMLDVLSWNDSVIGGQLQTDSARLAVIPLSSELAATGNIATVEATKTLIADVLRYSAGFTKPGLRLEMAGSAATGGETLMAARDAISYTELITVLMILVILTLVYRAPLLVMVPMVSIAVAVLVSTSLVALLSDWSMRQVVPWLDVRLFTTSRIFIVVILFGAGTDYCLFLISRIREEASHGGVLPGRGSKHAWRQACQRALSGVIAALVGSALTTVVGLGMLWVAEFGKFHYTGPVIAICLLVGLLVCTTLTPALLVLIGPVAFWPSAAPADRRPARGLLSDRRGEGSSGRVWNFVALSITRYPLATLLVGLALLCPPAYFGFRNERSVTFDLTSQLSPDADSRIGLELLSRHFDMGKINPVTLLIVQPTHVDRDTQEEQVEVLRRQIYPLPGVLSVRTIDDPLGDFSPKQEMSLLSSAAWKRRALRKHRVARRYFFSNVEAYKNRLARLDVVMKGDPFSIETAADVSGIKQYLNELTQQPGSPIYGAKVLLAGTTPSINDLRNVTQSDHRRIKVVVVIAVFLVLLVVLRRVLLCSYLIATVLLSYYATLGLTILFFQFAYGDDFVGLDWKLPLFLFVILVAIGQDYNVYLVTRIVEEERRLGWAAALRRAVTRTGGIITACGLVMAATFLSMTSCAWLPPIAKAFGVGQTGDTFLLRGIVELGFALGLGVLIDTFYVRTILVPSFVAAVGRIRQKRQQKQAKTEPIPVVDS